MEDEDLPDDIEEKAEELEERAEELEETAEEKEDTVEEHQEEAEQHAKRRSRAETGAKAASMIPEAGPVAGAVAEQKAQQEQSKEQQERRKAEQAEKEVEEAKKRAEEERRKAERLRKELKNRSEKNGGSGGNSGGTSGGGFPRSLWRLIFFIVLVFHSGVDAFVFQYDTAPVFIAVRVLVYLLAATILYLYGVAEGYTPDFVWIIAFAEILGPFLLVLLNRLGTYLPLMPGLQELKWLYVITPIFALFMSAVRGRKLLVFWVGALIVITIVYGVDLVLLSGRLPTIDADLNIIDAFWTVTMAIWNSFTTLFGDIEQGVQEQLQRATGGYYKGVVEDQQGEPVGLYIDDLRVPRDVYYAGDDVTFWADMRGKSFEKEITVATACSAIHDENETAHRGTTTPEEFNVFAEGFESVRCQLDELPAGKYEAQFSAGFNFRTWSYVTYTFVDQATRRNYLSSGQDINRQLDIPSGLKPTYTPGPVMLGMSSDIPQPVGVDPKGGKRAVNTVFGITLDNRWTDGQVHAVNRFDVLVPPQFKLTDCDAPIKELSGDPMCSEAPDKCARDMNAYRFTKPNTPGSFTTFTCRLRLADGANPSDVVPASAKKAQKTFVVKAYYEYALTEEENLEVTGGG